MTLDELRGRIQQLTQSAEQSAGQHNMVIGRLNEARDLLDYMEKKEAEVKAAIEGAVVAAEGSVAPTDTPVPAEPANTDSHENV